MRAVSPQWGREYNRSTWRRNDVRTRQISSNGDRNFYTSAWQTPLSGIVISASTPLTSPTHHPSVHRVSLTFPEERLIGTIVGFYATKSSSPLLLSRSFLTTLPRSSPFSVTNFYNLYVRRKKISLSLSLSLYVYAGNLPRLVYREIARFSLCFSGISRGSEIVTVLLVVYLKDVLSRWVKLQVRDAKGMISSFLFVEREVRGARTGQIAMRNDRQLNKKKKINLVLF